MKLVFYCMKLQNEVISAPDFDSLKLANRLCRIRIFQIEHLYLLRKALTGS